MIIFQKASHTIVNSRVILNVLQRPFVITIALFARLITVEPPIVFTFKEILVCQKFATGEDCQFLELERSHIFSKVYGLWIFTVTRGIKGISVFYFQSTNFSTHPRRNMSHLLWSVEYNFLFTAAHKTLNQSYWINLISWKCSNSVTPRSFLYGVSSNYLKIHQWNSKKPNSK